MKQDLSFLTICNRCIVSIEDFKTGTQGECRRRLHTVAHWNAVEISSDTTSHLDEERNTTGQQVEKKAIDNSLNPYSMEGWESFFEGLILVDIDAVLDLYSIFTFQPLHHLNLGVLKMLEDCMMQ